MARKSKEDAGYNSVRKSVHHAKGTVNVFMVEAVVAGREVDTFMPAHVQFPLG